MTPHTEAYHPVTPDVAEQLTAIDTMLDRTVDEAVRTYRDKQADEHERPDPEVPRRRAHFASDATAGLRRKKLCTHGSSLWSRSSAGEPTAQMPLMRVSSMITRSAIV